MIRLALAVLLAVATPAALAQPAHEPPHESGHESAREPGAPPAESTTHHQVTIDGKVLDVTAQVAALPIRTTDGAEQGEVVATSFTLAGSDPATRPVTFAVNGGPGSASAWLDLGALGPWRLVIPPGPIDPSRPPALVDNAESWLPFTDLVFLDPPGTGWARVLGGEEARKRLWSVDGDIAALAVAVRQWLVAHGRLASPKIVTGESYGGFRGPQLVSTLRQQQGVGVGGLLLVSPVLDFGGRDRANDPWSWMTHLPSFAAIARGAADRDALADVEGYAAGDFLVDFTRGERDEAATVRMSERVAQLTGLDPSLVRRRDGRVDPGTFLRERGQASGTVGSLYDGLITALAPFPASPGEHGSDPVLDALRGPFGSAAMVLYGTRLHWQAQTTYQLLNETIARQWDYGDDRDPESTDALRRDLALDPALRVVVAHGLYDLVTPYFASKLLLDQVPARVAGDRLRLIALPGGHMMYTRDTSRAALRDAARWVATGVSEPETADPPPAR